jgi:hypothetical protein
MIDWESLLAFSKIISCIVSGSFLAGLGFSMGCVVGHRIARKDSSDD